MTDEVLDNPAWFSLATTHVSFSMGEGDFLKYKPNILPVAALRSNTLYQPEFDAHFFPGEIFHLISGDEPLLTKSFALIKHSVCAQMVYEGTSPLTVSDEVVLLQPADALQMFELVQLVMPGYYSMDTPLLGQFYGIKKEGELVAMAGMRLCPPGYAELTAVVTHPQWRGRGFAGAVSVAVMKHLCGHNIQPFLHTGIRNEPALRIYRSLGFRARRQITWWRYQFFGRS